MEPWARDYDLWQLKRQMGRRINPLKDISDCILLSLRPEHAARIYNGEKTAELRKSFPKDIKFVFVYETAPVAAVTGGFTIKESIRTSIPEAVILASRNGIDPDRAAIYYKGRQEGWVIRIGTAVTFERSLSLKELRQKNHYFSIPQSFSYLLRTEGLTQTLLSSFIHSAEKVITLKKLSRDLYSLFVELVRKEVGSAYEDIDDDFILQIVDRKVDSISSFSTQSKHVLEARLGEQTIGFIVLTRKIYGAWKSGPTILLPEFRGLGLGQVMRRAVNKFCVRRNAISIYCTCAADQPAVVSYLLSSGMQFQARLRRHLSSNRDEFVFSHKIIHTKIVDKRFPKFKSCPVRGNALKVDTKKKAFNSALKFFLNQMPRWYFTPGKELGSALLSSILSNESGSTKYSDKPRALYAYISSLGRPKAAALVTDKRSGMLKINFVANVANIDVCRKLLNKILNDNADYRRLYLTVPIQQYAVIEALLQLDFTFEGMLNDPFGTGSDHACFGYLIPDKL